MTSCAAVSGDLVRGHVAAGFEQVAAAFARNFTERGEVGAALCVHRDGEPVVDLWGGLLDAARATPWEADTLQLVFSGSKGLVAVCLLMLMERGSLELDAPVARYWPEFAAAGKGGVLVRHVLCHQTGLPGLRRSVAAEDVLDSVAMARLLQAQAPLHPPGARTIYAPLTFGWLCDELVRRTDGRSLDRFFDEEVAQPLALELWFGLPEAHASRVAALRLGESWELASAGVDDGRRRLFETVWRNPRLFERGAFPWDGAIFRRASIPAAGAIGSARSMSRLMACLARGGELDGVRLLSPESVRLAGRALARDVDPLFGAPLAFGVGFELQTELAPFGPAPDAFGVLGAGGSTHGVWPTQRVGFSYCMNELRPEPINVRATAPLESLRRVLDGKASDHRRRGNVVT